MRIANVAVNGSKSYGPRLRDWLRDCRPSPDIVTVQKIGASKHFPANALGDLGYESQLIGGRHPHLGVAVVSHHSLGPPEFLFCGVSDAADREARLLTVEVGGLWVSSIYAPYGGRQIEHIERRVEWLERLRRHVNDKGYARRRSFLCGDFNVKLDEELGKTGDYTCYEQRELRALLKPDVGYVDLYREWHPDRDEKPGRTRGYAESDKTDTGGTSRLHLILASRKLVPHLRDARLDLRTKRPRPDAPPLIAEFEDIGA